jgi:hypothetical protein
MEVRETPDIGTLRATLESGGGIVPPQGSVLPQFDIPRQTPQPTMQQTGTMSQDRQALERITVIPPPRDATSAQMLSFIDSVRGMNTSGATLTIRCRPLTGFSSQWTTKAAYPIDFENFSFEQLQVQVGEEFGPNEYKFTFTVKGVDGSVVSTFNVVERIDLTPRKRLDEEKKEEKILPSLPPTVDPRVDMLRSQNDDLKEELRRSREMQERILADSKTSQEQLMGEMRKIREDNFTSQLNSISQELATLRATPATTLPLQQQATISEIVDAVTKIANTGMSLKQRNDIGGQQNQMTGPESATQALSLVRTGIELAQQVMKPMIEQVAAGQIPAGVAEVAEEGAERPGLMGTISGLLTNVFGNVVERVMERYVGPGMAPQSAPAIAANPSAQQINLNPSVHQQPQQQDAGVVYVSSILNSCSNLFANGQPAPMVAHFIRSMLGPKHMEILSRSSVDNIIRDVPSLQAHRMKLAEALSCLIPHGQPRQQPRPAPQQAPLVTPPPSSSAKVTPTVNVEPKEVVKVDSKLASVKPQRVVRDIDINNIELDADGLPKI